MDVGRALAEVAGRVLLAHMYLVAGFSQIGGYTATQAYMNHAGVAGALLPLVILTEIGGALLLIFGWRTRWAALGLAVFTALAALFFHSNLQDPDQTANWMKNWTIVGGMLVVFAVGPGPFSIDRRLQRRAHGNGA